MICLSFERKTRQTHNYNFCLLKALAQPGKVEKRDRENSIVFSVIARNEIYQNFNFCTRTLIQKLKTNCSSILFSISLVSLSENSMMSLLVEVFKSMTKESNLYVATITFNSSRSSINDSKLSHAVLVKHFFQRLLT